MTRQAPAAGMTRTLRENIDTLSRRRIAEDAAAPRSGRVAAWISCFAGSMRFVGLHALIFGGWIAANLLPGVRHFDPSLVMLAMIASVEAIFLSTFVLINQNRMAAAADRRADLDLHINLLAEHELTRLARLTERIAERLGASIDDPEFEEIKEDVHPDAVLDALDQERPTPAA